MNSQLPMTIRDYLTIFFRRKTIFFSALGICLLGTAFYLLTTARVYQSYSLIYIQGTELLNPLLHDMAVTTKYSELLKTMKEQVLSWPRLVNMTEALKMAPHIKTPLEFEQYIIALKEKIAISMYGTEIIRISYEDQDPYLTKQVVDYLTQSFIDESVQLKTEEVIKAIDFIRQQLDVYRGRLESSEKDLGEMKIRSGLETVEKQRLLVKEQLSKHEKVVVSEIKKEQDPNVRELSAHLADLERQLSRWLIDSTEDHPTVKELRKQIKFTKEKLDIELGKNKSFNIEERAAINPIYADLEQKLKELELKRNELLQKAEEIKEKSKKYRLQTVSDQELAALDRDARVNEQLYSSLLSRLESARLSQQLEALDKGTKFKIIEPSRLPLQPVKPNVLKIIFLSLVLGLGSGFAGIYLLEQMDHSIRTVEEAKSIFTRPLLGAISKIELEEEQMKKVNKLARGYDGK